MNEDIKDRAFLLLAAAISGTYSSMSLGHEPNFELLAAQSLEAALEFERKCEQEEETQCVSRVVNLKREFKRGYGEFMRGEDCVEDRPDMTEIERERLHGWRRAEYDTRQRAEASATQSH